MITLKTGLPRNGKTLSTVTELAALAARWDKHPGERRPVYQFGITGLKLAATVLEAYPVGGAKGDAIPLTPNGKPAVPLTFDEFDIPDGALIVIDECQDFFPPRGPSQKPPAHVAALNTHGHRDIDYVLMTQHPKLIDNGVRRLVNKHQHYRRAFGGKSAITYEWDVCSDSLEYRTAVKGLFSYPKRSFGLYTSAVGFTRPSFKVPAFVIVPLLAVPVAIWALPKAYSTISGAATGKGITVAPVAVSAPAASLPFGVAVAPPTPASAGGQPAQPAPSARAVAGCVASASRCMCVDQGGSVVGVDEALCRESSVKLGGLIPYDTAPRPAGERVAAVAVKSGPSSAPDAVASGLHGIASEGVGMAVKPRYSVLR